MIHHKTLAERLDKIQLRPMTPDEFNAVCYARKELPLEAIPYPPCAITYQGRDSELFDDIDTFLTFKDLIQRPDKELLLMRFTQLMKQKYGINTAYYISIAAFAMGLVEKRGCMTNIPRLRGFVADFIRKCMHPALVGPPNDEPIRVEGDLIQLDRNGSYPSVYVEMRGIPTGEPKLITDWNAVVKQDKSYYFVKIDVVSFKCKQEKDPYPMIEIGITYVDKTWMECLGRHYSIQYRFICGYYFFDVMNPMRAITEDLWKLRMELKSQGDDLQIMIKRMLNCIWGRSIWRGKPIHDEYIEPAWKVIGHMPPAGKNFHFLSHYLVGKVIVILNFSASYF
jgi:hypothetical protein